MDKIYLMQISKLADDNVKAIRSNCYDTLTNISEFTDGVNKILETDILLLLVDKMIEEKENYILTKVLVVLINLLYGKSGSDKALDTPVISRLLNLLTHADQNVHIYINQHIKLISDIFNNLIVKTLLSKSTFLSQLHRKRQNRYNKRIVCYSSMQRPPRHHTRCENRYFTNFI